MAWYPQAIRKRIPPGANDPRIIPVGIVYHVRDGEGKSLYNYFDGPSGGIESHFYIRYNGVVEQYRSTTYEADANYKGNSWSAGKALHGLLSVETEGLEHGEWLPSQIEALKKLTVWAANEHNFPLKVIDAWNGTGVGYHTMFGAPGPWTPVSKTCPGPDRIKQFEDIFVPWLEGGAGLEDGMSVWNENLTPGTPGNDITNLANTILPDDFGRDAADLLGYAAATLPWLRNTKFSKTGPFKDEEKRSLTWFIRYAYRHARQAKEEGRERRKALLRLEAKVDALAEGLSKLPELGDIAAACEAAAARVTAKDVAGELEVTVKDGDEDE